MHNYHPVQVLEALGVCSEDEQLYRTLLARPEATTTDLVADTGWATARVARHLRSLLSLGLASRTAGRPARYTPAVPEAAVELLALRKQAAIVQARLSASVLTQEFRAAHESGPFTVIRGSRPSPSGSTKPSRAPRPRSWCWTSRRTSYSRWSRAGRTA
ncbi:helix-turn-helix domain-containing protein [Kribbella qitaiheensis]|uniref:helix-turn-helix domain-containing protein n=1 Tax=Kribbella qitaiheensis TaxID=1544730 RepID=UPI001FE354F2|nr:helix-turn-helix domain-containing protein [Kribbella qitaiheensis]